MKNPTFEVTVETRVPILVNYGELRLFWNLYPPLPWVETYYYTFVSCLRDLHPHPERN